MKNGQMLVHVEPGAGSDARLRYALSMAQRREMKLIGVSVQLTPAAATAAAIGDAWAISAICDASREGCENAKEAFHRTTAGSGVECELLEASGIPAAVVCAEAGRADLVILSQIGANGDDGGVYDVAPADIIMACGTPVMVLSPEPPATFKASRILLAWKSTPQAARATRDALPLLMRAEEVVLTEIVANGDAREYEIDARAMADYLSSHGVKVSVQRHPVAGDPAEQLIKAADRAECDLIVTGAYGHSRFREWVLGGVTRSLLTARTLPCIFSH